MMVKVCGITNRDDALAAVDAGASALGFNFYRESPRYVAPEIAAELGAAIRATKVGIFVNEPTEAVVRIMDDAGLEIAQIYGDGEYPGIRTWRVWRVGRAGETACPTFDAEAILLDGFSPDAYGGTGKTFDWSVARGLQQRIILAGGLDADNVQAAIEQARPWGVDACSRIEKSPGIKDHEKMKRFIEAALTCSL
ncbi:MAG TPA: phosphoribosylanthranilate isomerase [Bryobacteraceae bacterium]|nr:phosphoribosylanthranilate isomerase [Bryobacteraceae bacterium]